jgi:hypothetical protein
MIRLHTLIFVFRLEVFLVRFLREFVFFETVLFDTNTSTGLIRASIADD